MLNSLPSHLVRGEHRRSKDTADTADAGADKRKNCDLHGLFCELAIGNLICTFNFRFEISDIN